MMYRNDEILAEIIDYLKTQYFVHTIILYGSRARNEATDTSDYDIIAIREKGDFERDCKRFKGLFLDAFIYSEEAVIHPDNYMVRIKDGAILCQKDNAGQNLLNKINRVFKDGPAKTPIWEKKEILGWTEKMLIRAKVNDIEGNFRLHWLLHDLLECYFKLRDQWYLGPKESFQWLNQNDKPTYDAFETALKPNAHIEDIERLMMQIIK